jgi:hypothetical protein
LPKPPVDSIVALADGLSVQLVELRARALKGFDRPVPVFAVVRSACSSNPAQPVGPDSSRPALF